MMRTMIPLLTLALLMTMGGAAAQATPPDAVLDLGRSDIGLEAILPLALPAAASDRDARAAGVDQQAYGLDVFGAFGALSINTQASTCVGANLICAGVAAYSIGSYCNLPFIGNFPCWGIAANGWGNGLLPLLHTVIMEGENHAGAPLFGSCGFEGPDSCNVPGEQTILSPGAREGSFCGYATVTTSNGVLSITDPAAVICGN